MIDTPPLEQGRGVVVSALVAATDVLVPLAPTPAEIERMGSVRQAVARAADQRVSGRPPRSAVLLTRTVAGAASTQVMGRPRGEVSAGQVLLRAASRRTGLDGFPMFWLSSDYCVSGVAGCPVWMWS